ncbi:hypothetical protein BDF20DRAFT_913519 [Mycotypha africana]|uniref:uncharacterized protein n=1 Tax=Mycotypha africana TaxID=64632 RepID=UPI002300743B|nr:uncharacterized protein BDF20DRAFT_913519 [Mycotypha africana]KAI8977152.1 hypothetical protein BDF20DRAFT_913519 [Mycotypha africana]
MTEKSHVPVDSSKKRTVTLQELLDRAMNRSSVNAVDKLMDTFMDVDKDDDGYINRDELASVLKTVLELDDQETLSDQDLDETMQSLDTDKDGLINYTELCDLLTILA